MTIGFSIMVVANNLNKSKFGRVKVTASLDFEIGE